MILVAQAPQKLIGLTKVFLILYPRCPENRRQSMNKSVRSVTSLQLILFAAAQMVSVVTGPNARISVRILLSNEFLTPSTPNSIYRHQSMATLDLNFPL